ncbi:MAG: hypothetical protein ACRCWJ_20685 [Casimicrobium sp.]
MFTTEDLKKCLETLSGDELIDLEGRSGVPIATIYKIRNGETVDPRLGTANKLALALGLATDAKVA